MRPLFKVINYMHVAITVELLPCITIWGKKAILYRSDTVYMCINIIELKLVLFVFGFFNGISFYRLNRSNISA